MNEVIFYEQIAVLKSDLSYRDSEISGLKSELEKLKKKRKKGVGFDSYNDVPPPPTGLFLPPKINLSYSGLKEFKQPEFKSYGPKFCEIESNNASKSISNELKESPDAPLVKNRASNNKDCSVKSHVELEKKTIVPTAAKIEFVKAKQHEKPVRKPFKYVEMYRPQGPRGNQRN
nr:hypothetical protein [Tanacetum cinerariifolium]